MVVDHAVGQIPHNLDLSFITRVKAICKPVIKIFQAVLSAMPSMDYIRYTRCVDSVFPVDLNYLTVSKLNSQIYQVLM